MKQIWVHKAVAALGNKGGFVMLPDDAADALIANGDAHVACSPFTMPDSGVAVNWQGWQAIKTEAAPVFTNAPHVSGGTVVGSIIGCDPGDWIGYPTPTVAYQWTADNVDIPAATGGTYTSVVGDVGKTIRCEVTLTNSAGSVMQVSDNGIVVTAT